MAIVSILVLSIFGLVVSTYSLFVERKVSRSKDYKPMCDINDRISCTKAFSSEYGKHFGISNTVFGLTYYVLVLLLALLDQTVYVFYLTILGVLASIYLAHLLYFKIKSYCVVCTSIYIINVLLLLLALKTTYFPS